jgi:ribonuclease R
MMQKDFDDALSYQKLENGHIEVGIHIADVTPLRE